MLLATPGNGISHIRACQAVYLSALHRGAAASRNFAGRQQPGRTNPDVGVCCINAVDLITRKHLLLHSHHLTSTVLRKLTDGGEVGGVGACSLPVFSPPCSLICPRRAPQNLLSPHSTPVPFLCLKPNTGWIVFPLNLFDLLIGRPLSCNCKALSQLPVKSSVLLGRGFLELILPYQLPVEKVRV